jgi:Tfp pilus assembly protein PilO
MRALNPREIKLSIITAAVIVLGLSYVVINSQLQKLKTLHRKEMTAKVERKRQSLLLEARPELIQQMESIKGQLPRHPEGQDLKSEFARQVQSLANRSGLRLTGLTPDPETYFEDLLLYQSSIRGSWSGSSENLVKFLHLLHAQGAVADIRELRLRNRSGLSNTLTGTFVLDFVYGRIPVTASTPAIDAPPESSETPVAP